MHIGHSRHIRFKEHKVKREERYSCLCGKKFKRAYTATWTENPFNKTFVELGATASNNKAFEEARTQLSEMKCPKCDTVCHPIVNI